PRPAATAQSDTGPKHPRGRAAECERVRRRQARRERSDQPGDLSGSLYLPRHRQDPPRQHPDTAGGPQPGRDRRTDVGIGSDESAEWLTPAREFRPRGRCRGHRRDRRMDVMTSQLTSAPPTSRNRIIALDVIRGFALCGILLVNLPPMLHLAAVDAHGDPLAFYRFYEDFVQNRFFPIFSFLFGIGFGLMWLSASERSPRPRLALLRRFAFLGVLGVVHQLLQPGEALLPYAIVGIVVLLPSTWIPARFLTPVTTVLGAVLLIAAIASGGGLAVIPGLFLLGFATGCSGFVKRTLDHPGRLALVGAGALAITV